MSDDSPTPRASGLWRMWMETANGLADRLEDYAADRRRDARLFSSPGRLDLLDMSKSRACLKQANRAETISMRTRTLSRVFSVWPVVPPSDSDRAEITLELQQLISEARELMYV